MPHDNATYAKLRSFKPQFLIAGTEKTHGGGDKSTYNGFYIRI